MPHPAPARTPSPDLLSLTHAARLAGQPKVYLRELAAAGKLAVFLTGDPERPKWRVSRAGLIEAGLLAAEPEAPATDRALLELIAIVREQAERIAALEEQRFQLGAQLGGAVERIAALEARALQNGSHPRLAPDPPRAGVIEHAPRRGREAVRRAASQLGEAGLRHSTELGARLFAGRLRLPARFQDDSL
jgi:hypothetical protein